ncbi:sugar transferase [Enterococcus sp. DIV0840]|uniref:sugar transferase n=1 Tax=Enterococcus TaxID=1350 RepID=UPI001A8C2BF4|nr:MULTISPECIES: sugar transferase [Enterococcus]MBO0434249.1 sugar transferase [Enterococcus sp. DIV0849a]MBO0473558.1 sugar transferase [Enterococcus ureasiticus]
MSTKNEWNNAKRIAIIIVDVLVFNFSVLVGFWIKFGFNIPSYNFVSYEKSAIYISLFFIFLNLLLGAYVFYNRTINDIVFVTVIGQFLTILFIMTITFAGRWFTFPRSVLIYTFIVSILLLSLWRILVYFLYLKVSSIKKVVILGTEESVVSAAQNFVSYKNKKHQVTTVIVDHYYENLTKLLDQIDIVYISSHIDENEKFKIYKLVTKAEKKLFLNTSFENLIMLKPNMMNFEDESIIEVSDFRIKGEDNFIKRLFDIVLSFVLLVIASPLMLIAAILVKVTSPGPIIYKQTRITLNQKEFPILKFRTMSATAEAKSGPVLSTSNDSRVTGVGKYLRALRIDELPQLINVIRGDMAIVGPRPERPFFVDQFNSENPQYYLRHNVRAGITGYAQVYGKYASDYNSKLNFDLLYIKNYSLMLDLKILLQTIKILFDKVSSQGVEEVERSEKDLSFLSENKIDLFK